jgi:hypothetical protein
MATQIHDIAISARGYLLDPLLLIALLVAILVIFTGFAGRVSVVVEDFRYHRTHRRNG